MVKAVLTLILWIFTFALTALQLYAGEVEKPPSEAEVKVAFLYNFLKFVEWPSAAFADANSPIIICILGENPFGDTIFELEGRVAQGKKVVIRLVNGTVQGPGQCHMVYVSKSEKDRLAKILSEYRDSSMITVGDMDGFAESGGIINFFTSEGRIRFEINVDAAKRAGVRISSQLLGLARIVPGRN